MGKSNHRGGLLFGKTTVLPELPVKLTAMSVLENQENTFIIMKPTVETQYIRVT